jgi:hypothetical protein
VRLAGVLSAAAILSGCTAESPHLSAAREFDRHPLYWLGERFEDWDLEHVEIGHGEFVTLVYGTCEPEGTDGGCAPPLQLQIQPLCTHLSVVARSPLWRTRRVRGAPVGTIDGAPVLFTDRVQVKVYRGEGSDPGLPMRALRALRSVNDVEPVLDERDPIPAAARAVLEGTKACVQPAIGDPGDGTSAGATAGPQGTPRVSRAVPSSHTAPCSRRCRSR